MSFEQDIDRFQRMKKGRIASVVHELLVRGGETGLDEFEGSIAVNYGIRRATLEEYFEDLKLAGMITIDKNKLVLRWDKEKTEEWLEKQGFVTIRKEKEEKS